MADTYANSYLTIADSSSTDDSSGCLPNISVRNGVNHVSPGAVSIGLLSFANVPPYIAFLADSSPAYLTQSSFLTFNTTKNFQNDSPPRFFVVKE